MSRSALIDLSNIRVICVDDDPVIRSVIRFALQRQNCQDVVLAHDGPEALDLCAGRNFDLLICDFQMAPMNGLDFLRQLAHAGLGEGLPVIMVSAETDPGTIQDAHELGVCVWIGKPVSAQKLIEEVGKVLLRRGKISALRQDPKLQALTERRHARLLAGLRSAEVSVHKMNAQPLRTVVLAQSLRQELDELNEDARALGYELIALLVARASDLVLAMTRNPAAATRGNDAAARALSTLLIAMKRIAQNRMEGDGAIAGLKLLRTIDSMIAPVRATLG